MVHYHNYKDTGTMYSLVHHLGEGLQQVNHYSYVGWISLNTEKQTI